jgi:hypothetical protein
MRRLAPVLPAISAAVLLCLALAVRPSSAAPARDDEAAGIAAKYPLDRGIAGDRDVLFSDDFEGADFARWGESEHPATTRLTRQKENVHSGGQSVEMTAVVPGSTGGGLVKWFQPGLDRVYARFYVKFPADANYVHHFVHIVGGRDKWSGFGKAGLRPDGTDFFTTGIEPDGKWGRVPPPGVWHFYTYWPDMKASPDGKFWGNDFSPPEPIPVARDQWTCVEMMLKCNEPGKSDGEQAFWINGKLAAKFANFRWRTTNDLKVNAFWLLYYLTPEALSRSRSDRPQGRFPVWFDDVVVATKYIGPMTEKGSKPGAPGGKFTPPAGY